MSDRERKIPYNFIYMWNLKKKTINEQTKHKYINRLTNTKNELLVTMGCRGAVK